MIHKGAWRTDRPDQPTPGPWHAADRGIGWEVHVGPDRADCYSRPPYCEAVNDGFRETFAEEDARLAAQAPAMLALLERLYQWDHLEGAADGPYWKHEIRAAIAAAKGEQP